jgi:Na+-transporting NADH:ubiquinone oxidoreductase subunit F
MFGLILASICVFLVVILLLVILLLIAKKYLSPSGVVKISINGGKKEFDVEPGGSLLSTLAENKVFLSSACGGKGSCGQCRCQVLEGGGAILPTEKVHFTRKEQNDNWRLGCQVKVKQDIKIQIPESILGVKKMECEVVSNRNLAAFIKEFIVKLPDGIHMDFIPGSYSQIDIPQYSLDYKDFDIDEQFVGTWKHFNMYDLKCVNPEPTIRAYSMANYPAEGDEIMLNVRIATPPFDRVHGGFMKVSPGIASSYIFSLKPGDKVMMSGPYGEFHPILDTKNEMLYIGGGVGMAPLRAHILHLLKTLNIRDRKISYWYGARSVGDIFYEQDFRDLEKEFPNFSFHIALSDPRPEDNWKGYVGFIHQVIYDNYLKDLDNPEDIEYYMCGPGPMSAAVVKMLDSLGVPSKNLMYDNFGG